MTDRAVVFVDGNNWYHSLRDAGVTDQLRLDHAKIAAKLAGPRTWTATRYYVGQMPQSESKQLYADQRRFLSRLQATDTRITVHLGRLEHRPVKSEAAEELISYLAKLPVKIDTGVYQELMALGQRHRKATTLVEKAVDVMIAVDMVVMAERDEFDTAYLLSADGDFTPAVQAVRAHAKKVFAVSASHGAQLAAAVDAFIRIDAAWVGDCYQ
jgi:uncharacterized LabA/DUF88 family protein